MPELIDAIIAIGPCETVVSLRNEAANVIRSMRRCSPDEAETILKDLEDGKSIEPEMIPMGGEIAGRTMPQARWQWVRPSTDI